LFTHKDMGACVYRAVQCTLSAWRRDADALHAFRQCIIIARACCDGDDSNDDPIILISMALQEIAVIQLDSSDALAAEMTRADCISSLSTNSAIDGITVSTIMDEYWPRVPVPVWRPTTSRPTSHRPNSAGSAVVRSVSSPLGAARLSASRPSSARRWRSQATAEANIYNPPGTVAVI
jgi:hypothetical protein